MWSNLHGGTLGNATTAQHHLSSIPLHFCHFILRTVERRQSKLQFFSASFGCVCGCDSCERASNGAPRQEASPRAPPAVLPSPSARLLGAHVKKPALEEPPAPAISEA